VVDETLAWFPQRNLIGLCIVGDGRKTILMPKMYMDAGEHKSEQFNVHG